MSSLLSTFIGQETLGSVEKCSGPFIETRQHGRLLDLTAGGTAYALIGWGNQSVNSSIRDQLEKFSHLDYKTYDDPNRHELADLLTSSAKDLDYCFLSGGSGAEACEMAIHMSYQQHCEEGNSGKTTFLSRRQSYHGATTMALALSDRPNLSFYDPIHPKNVRKLEEPYYLRNRLSPEETEEQYSTRLIEDFQKEVDRLGSDTIAAFVAETSLGGLVGDVPPPKGYWHGIREICNKHNIHLILDEVWCGTGTSGKYNCYEHDNIRPDFLFIGKTLGCGYLPISAVLTHSRFYDVLKKGSKKVNISTTFQGHSASTAAALAVQKIIKDEYFLKNVSRQGNLLRQFLKERLSDCSHIIDIRGRGLRNSIEYSLPDGHLFGQLVGQRMFERHKTIISGKWHRIGLCHALNISDDILFEAMDNLTTTIIEVADGWSGLDKTSIVQKHVY